MSNVLGIPDAILSPLQLQDIGGDATNNNTFNISLHSCENRRLDQNDDGDGDETKKRKHRQVMSPTDLCIHFEMRLGSILTCTSAGCCCLDILRDPIVRTSIAKYLVWYERKTKYDQDSIILQWIMYRVSLFGMRERTYWYHVPFDGSCFDDGNNLEVLENIRSHYFCTGGIQLVMGIGKRRFKNIRDASQFTAILPFSRSHGMISNSAIKGNDPRAAPLKYHFEYLLNLGEVRATRVVATLVDGVQGHANREDTVDMVYLPISMGYRSCYKRYMQSLGFNVRCKHDGGVVIDGVDDGKPSDHGYVSYSTYYKKWKREYPQLKVSRPAEDICQYCFVFANRHRYLANHSLRGGTSGSSTEEDEDMIDGADGGRSLTVGNETEEVRIDLPESASTHAEEARELLLLESAAHIRMARVQRALYQAYVTKAVADALECKEHSSRSYTFVVDYGQNMEIPIYNNEQPGCTYYYSPLSVYNLGVVDHAHTYPDGNVAEHMYCHVYNEGIGKKGANNVASLIVKTLRRLNLLREDSAGGELNIIFDNCSGQNKNNTVLKLAAWVKQMGYFENVNFVFLIVGHTKNAADRLFNSLKHEYRQRNIFTMQGLFDQLNASDSVTVVPSLPEDFLDYDKLFGDIYRDISGKIKVNHIFSCSGSDPLKVVIQLRQSNLDEHTITSHVASKKKKMFSSVAELKALSCSVLLPIKCLGLNPYKMVEMWKNYRPMIPIEFQDDAMYQKPDSTVMAKVKDEKIFRAETRTILKAKKYGDSKESMEDIAFGDGKEDG